MNLQGMLGSFMAGAAGGYQAGTEADWALEAEQEKQRGRMRLQQVSEEMDFQRGRRLQADKDIAQMERLRYTTENRPVKDARSSFARKASEVGMTPRELMEYENRLVKDARGVDAKTRMAAGAAIDKGFNLFLEGYDSGAVEGGLFSVDVEGVEPPTKEQWAGEKMPFEHGLYYGEDADKNGGVKQQSRSDSLFDAALARIGEEGPATAPSVPRKDQEEIREPYPIVEDNDQQAGTPAVGMISVAQEAVTGKPTKTPWRLNPFEMIGKTAGGTAGATTKVVEETLRSVPESVRIIAESVPDGGVKLVEFINKYGIDKLNNFAKWLRETESVDLAAGRGKTG